MQMSEFRSIHDERPRPPTWAEREVMESLRDSGIEDVFVTPQEAPGEFWETLIQATYLKLVAPGQDPYWSMWERAIRLAEGWGPFKKNPQASYETLLRSGVVYLPTGGLKVGRGVRLAAVEHLLDAVQPIGTAYVDLVNERARWFRVGVRIEGRRFIAVTSEHLHREVVQPTLLLLGDARFETIDGLYRKAFDRVLSGDPAGAVTAATSAVEEMLRLMLGVRGNTLEHLANQARSSGLISAAVYQFLVKISALRDESDAHTAGTDESQVAMLAVHLAGSILLFLGRTVESV
jgi:hypothetical protein